MKDKRLTEILKLAASLQGTINDKIDDLDPDSSHYDEKDNYLNDAYMELEAVMTAIDNIQTMKQSHYY